MAGASVGDIQCYWYQKGKPPIFIHEIEDILREGLDGRFDPVPAMRARMCAAWNGVNIRKPRMKVNSWQARKLAVDSGGGLG